MRDLSMNDVTFKEVVEPYKKRLALLDSSDLEDVFNLVFDLLTAEVDALKVSEPYAYNTIQSYEKAAYEVSSFRFDAAGAWEEVFDDE